MKLQLKKFDMSSIAPDKVVIMVGKRNTGKSFLVKDLLWYHQRIPVGTVISATESASGEYVFEILDQVTLTVTVPGEPRDLETNTPEEDDSLLPGPSFISVVALLALIVYRRKH